MNVITTEEEMIQAMRDLVKKIAFLPELPIGLQNQVFMWVAEDAQWIASSKHFMAKKQVVKKMLTAQAFEKKPERKRRTK